MARNPDNIRSKIQIPAGITPIDNNSQFPSHYSDFGFGGLRTVDNLTERDAIPALRRVQGMLVYVINVELYFLLSEGILNSNWVELQTGGGGNDPGTGLLEIPFESSEWTTTNAPANSLILTLTHNLNTENIIVTWYEDGSDGAVFVPWKSVGITQIRGCIPTGSAFKGVVRIDAFVQSSTVNSAGFRGSFNGNILSPTEPNGDWVETGVGTGLYTLTVTHSLGGTPFLNYNFFIDNIRPNLIMANTLTASEITLVLPANQIFGGEVFLTRII